MQLSVNQDYKILSQYVTETFVVQVCYFCTMNPLCLSHDEIGTSSFDNRCLPAERVLFTGVSIIICRPTVRVDEVRL